MITSLSLLFGKYLWREAFAYYWKKANTIPVQNNDNAKDQ